jgi:predicted Zn-dependent peptidase
VGDFKTAETKELLERYFGRIPRGKTPPPPVVTLEPRQIAEKRYLAEAETSPTLRVYWHMGPLVHKDVPALDLLSDLLSGRTGRLYKGLVQGRQVANEASAVINPQKYEGTFVATVTVKDGKDPAEAERALFEEITRLQDEVVPQDELQKVKNAFKANSYRRLANPFSIMLQLLYYEGLGDWRFINTAPEKAEAVTALDLQRVAREYLTKENRTVGVFVRKEAKEGTAPVSVDAELTGVPEAQRPMVKKNLEQIAAETDPAKLEAGIAQMRQMAEQVPPEVKPALELILKRAEERLAALTKK